MNGKKYVGQTIKGVRKRFLEHLNYAKNTENPQHMPLASAIRKYGEENFEYSLIEEVSEEDLDEREAYWISFYDTFSENGYNATSGGRRGIKNLEIDEEEMINLYTQTKSCREVAKHFGVDKECISNRLKLLGVKILGVRGALGIPILLEKEGFQKTFYSKVDTAKWLIENKISDLKLDSMRKGIKDGRNYKGYKITFLKDKI